jgi:hypothetical protein
VLSGTESWLQGVQRLKNSLEEFRVYKAQERQAFSYAKARTQSKGVRRGEGRQRSRPLRTCNSSKHWKKVQKLRREHSSRWIGWRRDLDR